MVPINRQFQGSCKFISGTVNSHMFSHSYIANSDCLCLFDYCVKVCGCVTVCVHIYTIPCSAIVVRRAVHVYTQHML